MVASTQLHDRDKPHRPIPETGSLPADAAMMLGGLMAKFDAVSNRLDNSCKTMDALAELVHDTQIEHARYYSGLEKANNDIQEIRDTQREVLRRLDNTVPLERFEKLEQHVKTLNGTDSKFSKLGIDINDPKRVDAVRRFIDDGIESTRTRNEIKTRVLQGIALAVAMALGAAAWNGIQTNVIAPSAQQQEAKR